MSSPSFNRQAGFTIIELTIATAIFSIVLLIVTAGIVNFTKQYIKGVHSSQTQETSRQLMSELEAAVQFSANAPETPTSLPAGWIATCMGNVTYSFHFNTQVDSSQTSGDHHAVIRSVAGSGDCHATTTIGPGSVELLGNGMRIQPVDGATNVISDDQGDGVYGIGFNVLYGDSDILNGLPANRCAGGAGSEYCADSILRATVQRRLAD